MLSYHRLQHSPRALRTFTGLDKVEFETSLPPFAQAWNTYVYEHHIHQKARKRRLGGGRKARLNSMEDKLLFILFYFKIYPLQDVIAFLFDMSQGRANEWMHKLSTVLHPALGDTMSLPERHPQNLEQVLALCVSVDVIIDGTERRTHRPTDADKQKRCYSGKKTPTGKNNLFVDVEERLVRDLSGTYAGSRHDKRICDEEAYRFPQAVCCSRIPVFKAMNRTISAPINRRKSHEGKS
jgi:hypothetical protein